MNFISPTKGSMSLALVSVDLANYVRENPDSQFKLIVGTDSQMYEEICYVTAIVVLRVGKGGRFYYAREQERVKLSLKERIFLEASKSLETAANLTDFLTRVGISDLEIEIHLDVGEKGKSSEIIWEVVGMVTGSGFTAKVKPEAYGASKVADKYTK